METNMTVQDLRILIMKNHIFRTSLAKRLDVAPVVLDKWLNSEDLPKETISTIHETILEMLKTWKVGEARERTPNGKLLKTGVVERYRKEIAKEKANVN